VDGLVDLAFAMMLGDGPIPLEAFDTAGEREIEVGDLAELTASLLGEAGMAIQRPPLDDTQADRYVGDATAIKALADVYRIEMKKLPQQIKDTAHYMLA
jgi:nucleoside-diphosphate-sugar epimerase